jgi:hypothetical protein
MVYLVGTGGQTVSMSDFRVQAMQYGGVTTTQHITVTLNQSGSTEAISSDEVYVKPLPSVIIMPGWENIGISSMQTIGSRIQALTRGQGGSISIDVCEPLDGVLPDVERIAQFNEQERTLGLAESPIIMIGYSDGATEVRKFSWDLKRDYPDDFIDYVGVIDLVRMDVDLAFPKPWRKTADMPPSNIMDGDNFYQRSDPFFLYGRRLVGCAAINNWQIVAMGNVFFGHLDMPALTFIQSTIATNAASAYLTRPGRNGD